jgi:hypothetical protein
MTALCTACGGRFTIPPDPGETLVGEEAVMDAAPPDGNGSAPPQPQRLRPPPSPQPSPLPPVLEISIERDEAHRQPIAPPPLEAPAAPPPRPRPVHFGLLYVLLGGAVTLAIILAAVVVIATKPNWEDRNRVAIRDLKSKAESLASEQKFQEAYDTYRKLDELVAGRTVSDAKLKAEIDKAHADRDGLLKRLLLELKEQQLAINKVPTPPDSTESTPPSTSIPPEKDPEQTPQAQSFIARNWPEYEPKALMPRATTRATPDKPVAQAKAVVEPKTVESLPPSPAPRATKTTTAPVAAGVARPPIEVHPRAAIPEGGLTDEMIGQSIQKGVDHLIGLFQEGRLHGGADRPDTYQTGLNALCVYALLQSSYAVKDDRLNLKGPCVRDLVNKMKAMPADGGPATYARAIRATALALLNRSEDRVVMMQDLNYLLNSHMAGAYTYFANRGGGGGSPERRMMGSGWDNSNSQYGLLGVWSAAEVGAEVNNSYWQSVENHWTRCQLANGAWDYAGFDRGGSGRLSMTVAGIASLFVTHDYLDAPKIGAQVGREPFSKALAKGLAYLETGDTAVEVRGGYTLYGLERVGLASGFKFLGDHDWYRELAGAVVRSQDADGSWGGEVETAYTLLFLARGRHPILMNKLRFDGPWANRPRDVSNLARFGSREMERPLNWQVVPITRDWTDWADSPILYIGTHAPVDLSDDELGKIRSFVQAGGLLFTQADGSKVEADQWAEKLAKKLFPLYEMKDLSDEHEIYHVLYKPSPHPKLRAVSNGARLLMVHSPADITQYWQMRQDKTRRSLFELGMNLFLYASGKGDLRNRLASLYIPPPPAASGGSISVARVKYPGNWDPEPAAWGRFARHLQCETDVGVNVAAVDMDKLDPAIAGFAHWTGTDAYTPTPAEIAAIRKFVEAGGVLLIDPCGGSGDFYESVRQALSKAFPEARGQMISKTHPIFTASSPGMENLPPAQVRPFVKTRGLGVSGRLDGINFGKGKVIYNPLDIGSGMLGSNTWGILGFEPGYATSLLKNMLIWSATGMKEE